MSTNPARAPVADVEPRIALIGTHDTKGSEVAWVKNRLRAAGCAVVSIDAGVFSSGEDADVGPAALARRVGTAIEVLRTQADRGQAIETLAEGVRGLLVELAANDDVHGALAIGGSGGSALAAPAMQELPVGFPKLLVSTMASGDVRPYIGASDITLTYSVVDVAGMNSVSEAILDNAVGAVAGMARAFMSRRREPKASAPVITMTMFGVTTPAADEARARLQEFGYEVIVFHATGSGGLAMEKLISSGLVAGVLDLTTTELCDELAGGILSAGPHRLEAAGTLGIPQVISVGALDMVNFGAPDTIPAAYSERRLLRHNPMITLMRTTADEMRQLGAQVASKAASSTGPTAVFLPLAGVSAVDVPGGPFHDPFADEALFDAVRSGLQGSKVELVEMPVSINDAGFGASMADRLHAMIEQRSAG